MWTQIVSINIGYWLIMAGSLLDYSEAAKYNGYVVGFAIALFSAIAIVKIGRPLQKLNIPFAIWLFFAPWVLKYDDPLATINNILCASLIFLFSSMAWQEEILIKRDI